MYDFFQSNEASAQIWGISKKALPSSEITTRRVLRQFLRHFERFLVMIICNNIVCHVQAGSHPVVYINISSVVEF